MTDVLKSPIEQRLLAGFLLVAANESVSLKLTIDAVWNDDSDAILNRGDAWSFGMGSRVLEVFPQASLDRYLIDFVVQWKNVVVAVECDGHDFHERTKEQADNDTKRARAIERRMPVLRFTGSAIFRDPVACAMEVFEFLVEKDRKQQTKASPVAVPPPFVFRPLPVVRPAHQQHDVDTSPVEENWQQWASANCTGTGECKRCALHQWRKSIVLNDGDRSSRLMFIGEGPGEQEDKHAKPFVGPAGELLTKMIDTMGWERSKVILDYAVRCRPPGNRNPTPSEIAACKPILERSIEWHQPLVIVALGRPAANILLNRDAPISALRGKFHDRNGIKVMPTFHPAYVLREPDRMRDAAADLRLVTDELRRLGYPPPHEPIRGLVA